MEKELGKPMTMITEKEKKTCVVPSCKHSMHCNFDSKKYMYLCMQHTSQLMCKMVDACKAVYKFC